MYFSEFFSVEHLISSPLHSLLSLSFVYEVFTNHACNFSLLIRKLFKSLTLFPVSNRQITIIFAKGPLFHLTGCGRNRHIRTFSPFKRPSLTLPPILGNFTLRVKHDTCTIQSVRYTDISAQFAEYTSSHKCLLSTIEYIKWRNFRTKLRIEDLALVLGPWVARMKRKKGKERAAAGWPSR